MAAPTLKKRKVTHTPVDDNDQEVFSTTSSKMGESSNEDSDAAQEQQSYHQAKSKPQHSANYSRDTARPFLAEAHHSSLFKFKLDELLAQVRPDYQKRMVKAENALRKLKEIIENIPSREPLSVCWLLQNVHGTFSWTVGIRSRATAIQDPWSHNTVSRTTTKARY